MTDAVIVFAKPPEGGRVKTRLTPTLSPEEAARLYEAFLRDIFARCDMLSAAVRVYTVPPAERFPVEMLPEHATLHEQQGQGLGARMHTAFQETFDHGCQRAVITGTDHPTLPASTVRSALDALGPSGARRVTIGPSTDGGYYLLGLSGSCPSVFDMSYSHPEVLADTLRAIVAADRLPVLLPTWYDVDRPSDLRRLTEELREFPERAVHTRGILKELQVHRRIPDNREFSTD